MSSGAVPLKAWVFGDGMEELRYFTEFWDSVADSGGQWHTGGVVGVEVNFQAGFVVGGVAGGVVRGVGLVDGLGVE